MGAIILFFLKKVEGKKEKRVKESDIYILKKGRTETRGLSYLSKGNIMVEEGLGLVDSGW